MSPYWRQTPELYQVSHSQISIQRLIEMGYIIMYELAKKEASADGSNSDLINKVSVSLFWI